MLIVTITVHAGEDFIIHVVGAGIDTMKLVDLFLEVLDPPPKNHGCQWLDILNILGFNVYSLCHAPQRIVKI